MYKKDLCFNPTRNVTTKNKFWLKDKKEKKWNQTLAPFSILNMPQESTHRAEHGVRFGFLVFKLQVDCKSGKQIVLSLKHSPKFKKCTSNVHCKKCLFKKRKKWAVTSLESS